MTGNFAHGHGYGYGIRLDPSNSNILWSIGRYSVGTNLTGVKYGLGAVKATDIGAEWPNGTWIDYKITSGYKFDNSGKLYAIDICKTDGNLIYVGGDIGKDGFTSAKLFKTANGGESWANITSASFGATVFDIKIDPDNKNIVYVATANNVFKSIDGGSSWSSTKLHPASALVIESNNDSSVLYAGTISEGVWRSKDAGVTWEDMNNGLNDGKDKEITKLGINPGKYLFAGTNGHSMFRWALGDNVKTLPQNIKSNSMNFNIVVNNQKIIFTVKKNSQLNFSLFDLQGREFVVFINKHFMQGVHTVDIKNIVSKLSKGLYLYQVQVGNQKFTGKLVK